MRFFRKLINSRRKIIFLSIIVSAIVISSCFFLWPKPCKRATGQFPQEVYVWQRNWNQAVLESIELHNQSFARLAILAAEVSWDKGRPITTMMKFNYWDLYYARGYWREQSKSVSLVIRIGNYNGLFSASDERTAHLVKLVDTIMAEAKRCYLNVSEMQIDFDCAESKLSGYRVWVKELKKKISPVPLVITALPCWFKRSEFRKLAGDSDGYVLQVHSLSRPKDANGKFSLCDPDAAKKYVEQAARIGVPFRVALPTYGYLTAFDDKGKFIGISAEGPRPNWPEGMTLRRISTEPTAMAELIRSWKLDRPELMQGVIWYRLPVEGDVLNWSWPTLSTVMTGQIPNPRLKLELRNPSQNLFEVELKNIGDGDYFGAVDVNMKWYAGKFIAGDAINGFSLERNNPNVVSFKKGMDQTGIRPGDRKKLGWIRLDRDSEVGLEIVSSK